MYKENKWSSTSSNQSGSDIKINSFNQVFN